MDAPMTPQPSSRTLGGSLAGVSPDGGASSSVRRCPAKGAPVSERLHHPVAGLAAAIDPLAPVFRWRGGRIVLLGHYDDGRWTLARGWLAGDALTDVRRWNFAAPRAFAGQVRRLVLEATDESAGSRDAFATALAWAESQPVVHPS